MSQLKISFPFVVVPDPHDLSSVLVDLSDHRGSLQVPSVEVSVMGINDLPMEEREQIEARATEAALAVVLPAWIKNHLKVSVVPTSVPDPGLSLDAIDLLPTGGPTAGRRGSPKAPAPRTDPI